jgi:hypothetical protein
MARVTALAVKHKKTLSQKLFYVAPQMSMAMKSQEEMGLRFTL